MTDPMSIRIARSSVANLGKAYIPNTITFTIAPFVGFRNIKEHHLTIK